MAKNNETVDRIQAIWNMIGGDEVVDKLIAGAAKLSVETLRRLTELTIFTSPASERNVQDFFQIREGLWLSDDFKKLILNNAQTCPLKAHKVNRAYADLIEPANDAEIGAGLPAGHVFTDVNVFLVFLADLIEVQWLNEGEGVLLNTEYRANIFFVEIAGTVLTVDVYWNADVGEWRCGAYRPGADRWDVGDRAFSATGA